MQIAYLLTGGNRGDREAYLQQALEALGQLGNILAVSSMYETEAWGNTDQEPFLNQAIALETDLPVQELLHKILKIEQLLGRIREEKYGPRTIDIDILLYGQAIVHEPELVVPHPQLPFRRFALQCLNDIAPDIIHPQSGKTISALLAECSDRLTVHKLT